MELVDQSRANVADEINQAGDNGEKSSGQQKYIEIYAPEKLKAGQNFLDQEPYKSALDQAMESSGLPIELLRRVFLQSAVRRFEIMIPTHDGVYLNKSGFNKLFQRDKALKGEGDKIDAYHQAISQALKGLKDYPYIKDYLETTYDRFVYGGDGSWNPGGRDFSNMVAFESTYPKWVSDQDRYKKQGERQVLLGIDEVFSQDFGLSGVNELRVGAGRENRRWRILTAAELVSEKR